MSEKRKVKFVRHIHRQLTSLGLNGGTIHAYFVGWRTDHNPDLTVLDQMEKYLKNNGSRFPPMPIVLSTSFNNGEHDADEVEKVVLRRVPQFKTTCDLVFKSIQPNALVIIPIEDDDPDNVKLMDLH